MLQCEKGIDAAPVPPGARSGASPRKPENRVPNMGYSLQHPHPSPRRRHVPDTNPGIALPVLLKRGSRQVELARIQGRSRRARPARVWSPCRCPPAPESSPRRFRGRSMTLLLTDDGCRGCATWTWSPRSECGGAESRAAASICGAGREAGRARTAPYPRVRSGAAAPAARPRQCAGSAGRVNAATADSDGITVRCGAGQLD